MQQNPVNGAVTEKIGERDVVFAFNGRTARVIFERTGVDAFTSPGALLNSGPTVRNTTIWALTQNKANGPEEQWPSMEEVEEYIDLSTVVPLTKAVALAITPPAQREKLGNAIAEETKNLQDSANSAPSPDTTSDSPTPNSAS